MRSFALEAPASAVLHQFWRVDFTDLIYPTQFLLLAYTADIAQQVMLGTLSISATSRTSAANLKIAMGKFQSELTRKEN